MAAFVNVEGKTPVSAPEGECIKAMLEGKGVSGRVDCTVDGRVTSKKLNCGKDAIGKIINEDKEKKRCEDGTLENARRDRTIARGSIVNKAVLEVISRKGVDPR